MIFFGTDSFSVTVLETLKERGILPTHIITVPDKPQGRKMIMTPPLAKLWGESQNIPVHQFAKLNSEAVEAIRALHNEAVSPHADVFIVASYGKIIPQAILDIPSNGALNIHPSLLPKYRGSSPLQYTILHDDKEPGVTIIKMDKDMDHGPIVAQQAMTQTELVQMAGHTEWPLSYNDLESALARAGAHLLADALPTYLKGDCTLIEQNHEQATFTKKIEKEDGLLQEAPITSEDDLTLLISGNTGYAHFLKYCAFTEWPGVFFFMQRKDGTVPLRVRIKEASWSASLQKMLITKITPEGKKDMTFKDFLTFLKN